MAASICYKSAAVMLEYHYNSCLHLSEHRMKHLVIALLVGISCYFAAAGKSIGMNVSCVRVVLLVCYEFFALSSF